MLWLLGVYILGVVSVATYRRIQAGMRARKMRDREEIIQAVLDRLAALK
jgi:hypothetical protein